MPSGFTPREEALISPFRPEMPRGAIARAGIPSLAGIGAGKTPEFRAAWIRARGGQSRRVRAKDGGSTRCHSERKCMKPKLQQNHPATGRNARGLPLPCGSMRRVWDLAGLSADFSLVAPTEPIRGRPGSPGSRWRRVPAYRSRHPLPPPHPPRGRTHRNKASCSAHRHRSPLGFALGSGRSPCCPS